jgi:glycerol-3-phosphate dehydrogenase (NAD(P)+)
MKICVLGSGAYGLALAIMLGKFGNDITVWTAFQDELNLLQTEREHKIKLPGVKIPDYVNFSQSLDCLENADFVIFGVPSSVTRQVAKTAKNFIPENAIVVNTSKGIEKDTFKRMSDILTEELQKPVVALSGPSHAEEVARGIPTAVVVESYDKDIAKKTQNAFNNGEFRVYYNKDVIGCELGGALKNIIALGAGICSGLGYGDNTKAALITRGLSEITRLGIALGAEHETFAGLTGIGDLIVTCMSEHSRNNRAGQLIGKGISPTDAIAQVGTVEGFFCCEVTMQLSEKTGVEMPITKQIYDVLFNNKSPKSALNALMARPATNNESEYLKTYR